MEETITINGIEYIPKKSNNSPIKIVILQRGWVAVGHWSRKDNDCILKNASIIRKWGTTHGLGELVSGPNTDTILDKVGVIQFDYLTVVSAIDCEEDKWANKL